MSEIQQQTLSERMDFGIRKGAACALADHKKSGHGVAIWRDGKVVIIPPEEIEIPEEFKDMFD